MDQQTLLKDILLIPPKDEEHSIALSNEGTVNAVFERLAAASPEKTILYACDRSLTFHDLDEEANRIGNALIKRGVGQQERVLLLMRRTSALVVSVFGVLKAGAVFIIIDPDYPRERIEQIAEDSEAVLVITDIPEIEFSMENAAAFSALIGETDTSRPEISLTPESMCFIIYTSGTTGRPKGVVLSHMGITNYVSAVPENAPMYSLKEKCSRMLCLSSVSFIVFLREIFGTVLNDIPVVLCSEEQAVNPMAISDLIREFIARKLPSYMIPSYYTCLKQFPLTPNGKVAMKALKELPVDTSERIAYEAPRTEEEKKLFGILSKVLGQDQFGINDDLFNLGLTSLTMISVISKIYDVWGLSVRVTDFMGLRTAARIAGQISSLLKDADPAEEKESRQTR